MPCGAIKLRARLTLEDVPQAVGDSIPGLGPSIAFFVDLPCHTSVKCCHSLEKLLPEPEIKQ